MIRLTLFGIMLSISFSAHGKELCTLAQTMLRPAQKNPCFNQMITQVKNANDRKWLLGIQNNWNPSPDLRIQRIAAGAEFFEGSKSIGSFQWLSLNPPILNFNGQLKVGDKSDEKSIVTIVQNLLKSQTTAQYLYQSLVPSADAQSENDKKVEELTILFTILEDINSSTAENIFSKTDQNLKNAFMPYMTMWQEYLLNLPLKCNINGAQSVPYKLISDKQDITISKGKGDTFIIEGLDAKKKFVATYKSLPTEIGHPCIVNDSKEIDEKYCQPGWEEFFKQNPKARKQFYSGTSNSKSVLIDCISFEPDINLVNECAMFWIKQSEKFKHYSHATLFNEPVTNMHLFECLDDDCKKSSPLSAKKIADLALNKKTIKSLESMHDQEISSKKRTYIDFLNSKGIDRADDTCTEDRCVLPKLNALSIKDRNQAVQLFNDLKDSKALEAGVMGTKLNLTHLGFAISGTKLLSECCKSDKCVAAAKKNYSIQLEKEKKTDK